MSSEQNTPDSTEYAIEVNGLSKCYQIYDKPSDRLKQMLMRGRKQYYKEFWALKDVSFKIKKGETVGIIGRNGSGKSTLLQMICGTLNPTGGEVKVNGRVAALLELGAGFNPEFSGVENVYMAASLYGLSKEEVDQRFDAIAAFADIGDHIHQPVKTYSSGMYVRLAFAVIAHVDADILVVDEALAVGDAYFTQKCMRFINRFKAQDGTLIFVSHDTNAILNLCKKVILLSNGLVSEIGEPKKVSDIYLTGFYEMNQKVDGINNYNSGACLAAGINTEHQSIECKEKNKKDIRKFDQVIVSKSDLNRDEFGDGGAKILDIYFRNIFGEHLEAFAFEEKISLRISCLALRKIDQPIVGFTFRDRLGQSLFVNNTLEIKHHELKPILPGQRFFGEFEFTMPILQAGDYAISPAVADGDQQNHIQLHWIHDAIILRVRPESNVMGLIGLPINKIELGIFK